MSVCSSALHMRTDKQHTMSPCVMPAGAQVLLILTMTCSKQESKYQHAHAVRV